MNIGDNIKKIRLLHKLNQEQFAERLNLTKSHIAQWETNRNFPKLENLILIATKFNVSIDEICSVKTTNERIEFNIFDFETPAAAGNAIIINDIDKTKAVPNLYLPGMKNGTYIRLPIKGDSMHSTIKDGDKAVGILINHPKEDLRSGHIYTVIDNEDGLVTKRLYKEGKDILEFVSDNEIYPPYKRKFTDILAFFKVVEVHTTDLRNYWDDVRRDVRVLQKQVQAISKKIGS